MNRTEKLALLTTMVAQQILLSDIKSKYKGNDLKLIDDTIEAISNLSGDMEKEIEASDKAG